MANLTGLIWFTVGRDILGSRTKKTKKTENLVEVKKPVQPKKNPVEVYYKTHTICLKKFRRCQSRNGERPEEECSSIFRECLRNDV